MTSTIPPSVQESEPNEPVERETDNPSQQVAKEGTAAASIAPDGWSALMRVFLAELWRIP